MWIELEGDWFNLNFATRLQVVEIDGAEIGNLYVSYREGSISVPQDRLAYVIGELRRAGRPPAKSAFE